MPKIHQIVCFAFIWLVIGCGTNDSRVQPSDLTNIRVITDDMNFLTARIHFETEQFVRYEVLVTPLGESEHPVSTNSVIMNSRIVQNRVFIDLLGLEEDVVYKVSIFDLYEDRKPLFESTFRTAPLPDFMNEFLPEINENIHFEGLILVENRSLPAAMYILEPNGRLVMARSTPERIANVKMTQRNTLLSMLCDGASYRDCNIITETTVAGDTLLYLKKGTRDFNHDLHHDLLMTDNGNIVAIYAEDQDDFTVDGLVKLDRMGNKIWQWDTEPFIEKNYETYTQPWANSVFQDNDGNYIVSFRRISQVWKLNRDTREVMWRLGSERLIQPTIHLSDEDTFLMQHFAHQDITGRLLLLDNGQDQEEFGFNDHRPYTRISQFSLDQDNSSIQESSHIDLPEKYYTRVMGSVEKLDNGFMVGSSVPGYIIYVSTNGDIMGELKFGGRFYRAEWIENFMQLE